MPSKKLSVYERFGTSALPGSDQTARKYVVKGGDTPPSIAAFVFDGPYDSEAWRQLLEANGITDIDAITPGLVLTIPTLKPTGT